MLKSGSRLVYLYAKKHWSSGLPKNLIATNGEIRQARDAVLADLASEATQNGIFVRLAGQSGSGKTTQLLPAAEALFSRKKTTPVLVAARKLATYHPHYNEIMSMYGEAEIRKRTDDFATVLMYLVMKELTKRRYDLIIDVSFASVKVEALFNLMTRKYDDKNLFLMAVAPDIAEKMLKQRSWRHDAKLEKEFMDSTAEAMKFYGSLGNNMRVIVWNYYDKEPAYDGKASGAFNIWWREYNKRDLTCKYTKDQLINAKIEYVLKH